MEPTPADLRTAYDASRAAVVELVGDLDDDQLATTVPTCPDWSVQDLVAHLTSSAAEPQSGNLPGADMDAWLAANVEDRRDRSVGDLVAEWEQFGPGFGEIIESFGATLANVVFDTICHEHDLRHALARPGEQGADRLRVGLAYLIAALSDRLTEAGLPAVRVVADGEELIAGAGEPALSIETSTFEAFRLLGSRRSAQQVRTAGWDGDVEPYLAALDGYGFPAEAVDEVAS